MARLGYPVPGPIDFADLLEEDEIEITGTSGRPAHYVGLRGVVAVVDDIPGEEAVKVWPFKVPGQEPPEDGKVWFMLHNIESIILLRRY